jgi:nucleoside triphosphate pyrophosphatase
VEEEREGDAAAVAARNARRKASAVPGALVLGADTVVSAGGDLLGKPDDEAQAREHLERLGGRVHEVVGGIAIARHGEIDADAVVTTRVRFRTLTPALLDWYLATGEWRERAGGYAIQGAGAALVAAVEGDYLNVVGLPLARLLELCPELLPGA